LSSKLIFDTTSLICLVEISALDLIFQASNKLGYSIILPKSVWTEFRNNPFGEQEFKSRQIKIITSEQNELEHLKNRHPSLGKGELEAIIIAKDARYGNCIAILDDKKARNVACNLQVKHHGLLWLIEHCCKNNMLKLETALSLLDRIESSNFRVEKNLICEYKRKITENFKQLNDLERL
jgi:predicted nucleic acid-binding protein